MYPPLNFRFAQPGDPQPNPIRPFNFSFPDPNSDPSQEEPYSNLNTNQSQTPDQGSQGTSTGNGNPPTSLMDAYRELLQHKQGPAMTAYMQYLDQGVPSPEDYKPGKLTRLGAILSGASAGFIRPGSGAQAAQQVLNQPYDMALQRWGMEGQKLKEASTVEENAEKNRISNVALVGRLSEQSIRDQRLQSLADSLIANRNMNMEKTSQMIANNGAQQKMDKNTGILYIVKDDGSSIPVGKFDQTTGEKIADKKDLQANQGAITGKNEATRDQRTENRETNLENIRQTNRQTNIGTRAANTIEAIHARADAAAANAAKRGGVTNLDQIRQIKTNAFAVNSLVDANPDKYGKFWDKDTMQLKGDASDPAYQELYGELYRGVKTSKNQGTTNQPAVKTTKGGNSVVRSSSGGSGDEDENEEEDNL